MKIFNPTISGSLLISGSVIISGSLNIPNNSGITSSLEGTSSWANNAISSSYSLTASYALNALTAGFPFTGSAQITGSLGVTGSVLSTEGFTGSLFGTSSFSTNSSTSSFVTSSNVIGPSGRNSVLSSSYALTASFALNAQGSGFPFTGSAVITGSLIVTGSVLSTRGFTGSLQGTASWANNSISASFASQAANATTASYILQAVSASLATSASQAATSSYVLNAISASFANTASSVNTLSQNLIVSGGLTIVTGSGTGFQVQVTGVKIGNIITDRHTITGSINVSGSITSSLFGTSSWANNASTASYILQAISASFSSTASSVNNLVQNLIVSGNITVTGSSVSLTGLSQIIQSNVVAYDTASGRLYYIPTSSIIAGGGGGGSLPGGSSGQLQYNIGGASFGGIPEATYNAGILNLTGSLLGTSSWANNALTASNILGGITNYVSLWSGSTNLTNSIIYQSGSRIAIGSGAILPGGALVVRGAGATNATKTLILQNSTPTDTVTVFDNGNVNIGFTTDQGYQLAISGSVQIGSSTAGASHILGTSNTSIVWSANNFAIGSAIPIRSVIINPNGAYTSLTGTRNTFVGYRAGSDTTTGQNNTFIGNDAGLGVTTGGSNIVITGQGATTTGLPAGTSNSVTLATEYRALDASYMPTSRYAFIGGGFNASVSVRDFFFGQVPFTADAASVGITFYAPAGSGSDVGGAPFTIAAGRGTGTGSAADLIFQTSTTVATGTTLQTPSDRVRIKGQTGNVIIGSAAGLDTGSFRLNVSGSGHFLGSLTTSGSFTVVTGSGIEFQVTNTGVKIGSIITDQHTITGSISVSGSIIGSLFGTSSWANNSISASFASNSSTASFINTLRQNLILSGGLTIITGSGIEFQVVDTGIKIGNIITDVHTVTGSLSVSGSITSSLFGTSSWATSASQAITASYILNSVSSSFATTASNAISASFATTASFVNNLTQNLIVSGNLVVTGSSITAPNLSLLTRAHAIVYDTASGQLYYAPTSSFGGGGGGSTPPGGNLNEIQYNNGGTFGGIPQATYVGGVLSLTGSLQGTASHALTASYALNAEASSGFPFTGSAIISGGLAITGGFSVSTGSGVEFEVGSSGVRIGNLITDRHILSGSLNITGSLNVSGSANFIGPSGSLVVTTDVDILVFSGSLFTTGSIITTGSINVRGGITGSLFGTASSAISASRAFTASFVDRLNQNLIISGSAIITGSLVVTGSSITFARLPILTQPNVLTYDSASGRLYYIPTSSIGGGGGGGSAPGGTAGQLQYNLGGVSFAGLPVATYDGSTLSLTGSLLGVASTSSFINTLNQDVAISGGLTVVTGSGIEFQVTNTGTKIGNLITDTHAITGSISVLGSITGSLLGTSSLANISVTSLTASFVTSSNVVGPFGGNSILSSSYALTASFSFNSQTASYVLNSVSTSFAETASSVSNLNQNVIISNGLTATGSIIFPSLPILTQPNVVSYDTASGRLYYIPTSSLGVAGGGGGSATPGGSAGQLQFNLGGVSFDGIPQATYDKPTGILTLTGSLQGTASQALTASYATNLLGYLNTDFDGLGSVILINTVDYYRVPRAGVITAWSVIANGTNPSMSFDVWVTGSNGSLPTASNSICSNNFPVIFGGLNTTRSVNLTSWTTAFNANSVFGVNIRSSSAATRASLLLEVRWT